MAQTFTGSLSQWLFLLRGRGLGGACAPEKPNPNVIKAPSRTTRGSLPVEFVGLSVDQHAQIVPIVRGSTGAPPSNQIQQRSPRWIHLRVGGQAAA